VIDLDFSEGTRTTSILELVDVDAGVRLCDGGAVVTLTLRWPDDPAIARERNTFFATQNALADAIETATDSTRAGALMAQREDALRAYAAALVCGWSLSAPCTPDGVLALFARAPFAYALVVEAAGDHERFLPESLRASRSASAPSSPAVAG
jgi:hypothetical protein